jgi:alanyl-tRNA synthetase
MGSAYPELMAQQSLVEKVIKEEEEAFIRTLNRASKCWTKAWRTSKPRV